MDEMASEDLAGRLLVATPMLGDPNLKRTVVLIVEHESEQGTLGVVLNRPTKVPVGQVLEPWDDLATSPSVVFTGGPVAPNSALALALGPGTGEPVGSHPLAGAPGMTPLRPRPRPGPGHCGACRLAPAGRRPGHDPARPGRPRRPARPAGSRGGLTAG